MGKYIRINADDGIVQVIEGEGEKPSLELMQQVVGGYIESVYAKRLPKSLDMLCNEEGKLEGLGMNFYATALLGYYDDEIVGDVIIVGNEDCESRWLTEEEIEQVKEVLK